MSDQLPLAGLKVLDLASFIAGPVATTVMGDYGAEVIKIEPPGEGDPHRKLGQAHSIPQHPVNFCWHLINRNKRSIGHCHVGRVHPQTPTASLDGAVALPMT